MWLAHGWAQRQWERGADLLAYSGALSGERARFAFDEGADELGKSGSAAHARFIHTFEL